MDACPIQQPHSSMGHSMGTHLTLQAPRPISLAILQVTHQFEAWFIYQIKPPTLPNKICATVGCSQFYMVNRQTFYTFYTIPLKHVFSLFLVFWGFLLAFL